MDLTQDFRQAGDGDQGGVLQHALPDIAHRRQRKAQHARRDDPAQHEQAGHAHGTSRFDFAARNGMVGAADRFGLIGARDDADRERADHEAVEAEKPTLPEQRRREVSTSLPPK